jgi:hypothetical protein
MRFLSDGLPKPGDRLHRRKNVCLPQSLVAILIVCNRGAFLTCGIILVLKNYLLISGDVQKHG